MPHETFVPSDIVAALIYFTHERFLLANPHRLHKALRVAREVSPLLERFSFSASGPHLLSRQFDEALSTLKLARVIRMENTDYQRYIVDSEAVNYIESAVLPRFTSDEKDSLAAAAAILKEECGETQLAVTTE
jgi:hypothetical protein